MGTSSVWLHERTAREVERYLEHRTTILLPVGSVEQHGSHIATGCDSFTALGVAESVAAATETIVAPPLWYGWSTHHREIPGTVTIRPETLIQLTIDVGTSLARQGFRQLILVNGHRFSNVPPLGIAATTITTETPMLAIVADLAYMAGDAYTDGPGGSRDCGFGHADEHETSHMMHLRPELVDLSLAPPADRTERNPWAAVDPWHPSLRSPFWPIRPKDVVAHPTGGNPRAATAAHGARLHQALVRDLSALVDLARATSGSGATEGD